MGLCVSEGIPFLAHLTSLSFLFVCLLCVCVCVCVRVCVAGCFKPGENGTILKKSSEKERECLTKLMKDILRPYIPEYKREVERTGESILCAPQLITLILLTCFKKLLGELTINQLVSSWNS